MKAEINVQNFRRASLQIVGEEEAEQVHKETGCREQLAMEQEQERDERRRVLGRTNSEPQKRQERNRVRTQAPGQRPRRGLWLFHIGRGVVGFVEALARAVAAVAAAR